MRTANIGQGEEETQNTLKGLLFACADEVAFGRFGMGKGMGKD
jgi:hypothetical protein